MTDAGVTGEADLLASFRLKRCVKCSYDLRGRGDASNCPECGLDISDALVVEPIYSRRGHAGWIGVAVVCLVVAINLARSSLIYGLIVLALAAICMFLGQRARSRHRLGPSNLMITTTAVVRNERGSLRGRAMRDLAMPELRRDAIMPLPGRGQPVFAWILEYGKLAGDFSTHFRATEEQANALRDEVVRRMEDIVGDAPVK